MKRGFGHRLDEDLYLKLVIERGQYVGSSLMALGRAFVSGLWHPTHDTARFQSCFDLALIQAVAPSSLNL